MKPETGNSYFDQEQVDSRHKIMAEYRELAKQAPPLPEKDWGVIWALTGPEETFAEGAKAHPGEEHKTTGYNQTKRRFETALRVAREVTALRLGKEVEKVTSADIKEQGPIIYWGGKAAVNDWFKEFVRSGDYGKTYDFPVENIKITDSRTIQHTGHQFEEFPQDLIPENSKVAIVTDLYHIPRVKRYMKKHQDKFPAGKSLVYPSQPSVLPKRATLQEIRKILLYSQQGILPPEGLLENDGEK